MFFAIAEFCNVGNRSELLTYWLKGKRDYNSGVKLFEKHGGSAVKVAFFGKGETELRREMLIEAITLLQEKFIEEEQPKLPEDLFPQKKIASDQEYELFTPEVKNIIQKVKDLYSIAKAKKAQILKEPDKLQRGILANEVRDCDEESSELLAQVDYFKEHGKLPIISDIAKYVESLTEADLYKRIMAIRPKISRYKKNVHKQEELAQLTEEYNLIMKKLDVDAV
jgi:hypothetical protein